MLFTLKFGTYEFPNQTFEVEGFPTDRTMTPQKIVQKHGAVIQTPFMEERKFNVIGKLHSPTNNSTRAQLDALQQGLLSTVEKTFQDQSNRYINAYVKNIETKYIRGLDKSVVDVEVEFVAQNPFFYAVGSSSILANPLVGGTSNFDLYSDGNVFSEPNLFIYASGGTITDDVTIKNLTDESNQLRFRGEIADGTTLQINTETYEVINNGVDALTYFEGRFLHIIPGTNTYQLVGATMLLTAEWKNRWL